MKCYEIMRIIEEKAPLNLAYEWDNVGLLIGDKNKEISRIFLTLDVNPTTMREAVKLEADMIISHHPMFFEPLKRIEYGTPEGETVRLAIENNIPVYAAHTNMDTAKGGINDKLAEIFQISDVKIIERHTGDMSAGLGRYGKAKREVPFSLFTEITKMLLKTPIRYAGNESTVIKNIAVASGACAELIPAAKALGCDVIITSDLKYHQMIDAYENGMCVIDAGHYPTEICVLNIFEDILKDTKLEIIKSENKDIFKFLS